MRRATRANSPRRMRAQGDRAAGRSRWTNFASSSATKATAKITMPAPSTMHFYRFTDWGSAYTDAASVLRRSRQGLPGGDRRARRGGLPLRADRRGGGGDPVRSGGARKGEAGGRGPGPAGRPLHRRDQRGGEGPAEGHDRRRARVPRQLQGHVPVGRRLRLGGGEILRPHRTSTTSCSSSTRRAPAVSRRCAIVPKTKGVVLGLVSSEDAAAGEASMSCDAAPTRRRSTSIRRASPSARSADSRAPWAAIR